MRSPSAGSVIRKWLKDRDLLSEDGFLNVDYDGPTELFVRSNGSWSLSYEGRTDEVAFRGRGLGSLLRRLVDWGR